MPATHPFFLLSHHCLISPESCLHHVKVRYIYMNKTFAFASPILPFWWLYISYECIPCWDISRWPQVIN
jgi:hypothetical protein